MTSDGKGCGAWLGHAPSHRTQLTEPIGLRTLPAAGINCRRDCGSAAPTASKNSSEPLWRRQRYGDADVLKVQMKVLTLVSGTQNSKAWGMHS